MQTNGTPNIYLAVAVSVMSPFVMPFIPCVDRLMCMQTTPESFEYRTVSGCVAIDVESVGDVG